MSNTTINRQDSPGLTLERQPDQDRNLRRQFIPGGPAVATNGRFEPGPAPAKIGSLAHWYRVGNSQSRFSDLGGTVPAGAGDPLGVLADEVGDRDLSAPSTGTRPMLTEVDGRLLASFDGIDDYLRTVDNAFQYRDATVIMILGGSTNAGYYLDNIASGNSLRVFLRRSGTINIVYSSGSSDHVPVVRPEGSYEVLAVTASDAETITELYRDGVLSFQSTANRIYGVNDLLVGNIKTLNSASDMNLAEVMVFNERLTAEQIVAIQRYANEVYGGLGVPLPYEGLEAATYGVPIGHYTTQRGVYTDGATVVGLEDVSGEGRPFGELVPSGLAAYDGTTDAWAFDGNDVYVRNDKTAFDLLHQVPQGTVVARARLSDINSGSVFGIFATSRFTTDSTGVYLWIDDRGGRNNRLGFRVTRGVGGTVCYSVTGVPTELPLVAGEFFTVTAAWGGGEAVVYFNGASLLSDDLRDPPSSATSAEPPEIGRVRSNVYWEGDISDLLVFSDKLDASTIADLVSDLNAQYL